MKNNILLIFLFMFLFLQGISVSAYEVAVVKYNDVGAYDLALEGFKSRSKANITEYAITSELQKSKKVVKKIKSKQPDLILTVGPDALSLAAKEINDIPIVYCMVMFPEKLEIANDKKEITGVTMAVPLKHQIRKLQDIKPGLKTLGIIYNPKNTKHLIEEAEQLTNSLGIKLIAKQVDSQKDVPNATRKLLDRIDVFLLLPDPTVITINFFEFLLIHSAKNKTPIMTYSKEFVQAGAHFALSPDYFMMGKQSAEIAENIMSGNHKPYSLVVDPDVFILTININSVNNIGLNIPPDVMSLAKKISK